MRRFLHLCLNRTPVVGLLMAALLFRALIPTGFMPTRADDGTIVMELCSGFTTKTVLVHLDAQADHTSHASHLGSEGGSHDSSHGDLFEHPPCGFAVATPAATPPAMLPFSASIGLHPTASPFAIAPLYPPSILRSQAPRGPPLV